MPNVNSPDSRDYSKYDAMATQELERILDHYFLFPEDVLDKDLMVHIMEVLAERDIEVINANISDPNVSWDNFLKAHPGIVGTSPKSINIPTEPAREKTMSRKALRRAVGIAAVLVCVLLGGTATAYAAGIDLFHVIAHWTDDTFCFRPVTSERKEKQIPEQLQPLYEELKSFEAIPLVPTYLPEGYELDSVESFIDSKSSAVLCELIKENESIVISYISHNTATEYIEYEKDNGDPEILDVSGTIVYLLSNSGSYTATWIEGDIESCISMCSKEELIKIVESLQ